MNEDEYIDDMITKFIKITNGLASLGDEIDKDQKVRKEIRALPPSWEVKFITLKELNDKEEMELIDLIGNLKTHKMKERLEKRKHPQKKKTLASKSTPTISNDEIDDQENDEDLFLLVKNVRRMYNKGKFNNRRRWQGKEEKKMFATIAGSPNLLLLIARIQRANPLPPRGPTKRKP